jgi:hypothetical protein
MKVIYTRKGQEIFVDDEDYESLSQYVWWISEEGYASRSCRGTGRNRIVLMHRQIMGLDEGDKALVDHRNKIKHDNQRLNLRVCNKAQNAWNTGKTIFNTTGFKGIYLRKSGRYGASIRHLGRNIHLGTFDTAEEAHAAYCNAATQLHGEFANHG